MFSLGLRCWTVAPSRSWTVLSLCCKTRRVLSTRWCKRWARLRQRLCWSQQEGEVKKSPLKHGWKICIHTVSMLSSLWQQPEQNNLDFSVAATTRCGLLPTSLSHTQTEKLNCDVEWNTGISWTLAATSEHRELLLPPTVCNDWGVWCFLCFDLIWSVSVFKLCWNHKLWLHCHMWTSYSVRSVSFRIWPWIPQPLYFLYTNFHKVHVICNSPCLLDLTKDLISVLYLSSNICQKAKTTQYTKTNVTMCGPFM